jgi:hypothetical protein
VSKTNVSSRPSRRGCWLIPYRKNVAGVSVPSRFYHLLAVGSPLYWSQSRMLTVTEKSLAGL